MLSYVFTLFQMEQYEHINQVGDNYIYNNLLHILKFAKFLGNF